MQSETLNSRKEASIASRDRWDALKAAYEAYRNEAALLELRRQAPDSATVEDDRLAQLMEQWEHERAAFERYIEARMEFQESCLDDGNSESTTADVPPAPSAIPPNIGKQHGVRAWLHSANVMPVVVAAVAGMLAVTSVSLLYQQSIIRGLRATCAELREHSDQILDKVAWLQNTLDAKASAKRSGFDATLSTASMVVTCSGSPLRPPVPTQNKSGHVGPVVQGIRLRQIQKRQSTIADRYNRAPAYHSVHLRAESKRVARSGG